MVEVLFGETALEVRTGVDARGSVALVVDVVAGEAVVLPLEEVVEPDLVERSRRREGGEVAADAVGGLVGTITIAAAFQRMNARIRRSMSSLPGKNGWFSAGMVLM